MLPGAGDGGGHVGPGARGADGRRHRERGPRAGRGRGAGAGAQHQEEPALRPKLRVLLGGPPACGHTRHESRARRAVNGGRLVHQALCRELAGVQALWQRQRGGRAHPARDLPARLRDGGARRQAADGDERLRDAERRLLQRQPPPPARHPARRVGLRRRGGDGLGRHARPRGRVRGRLRPGHARRRHAPAETGGDGAGLWHAARGARARERPQARGPCHGACRRSRPRRNGRRGKPRGCAARGRRGPRAFGQRRHAAACGGRPRSLARWRSGPATREAAPAT